MKRKKTKIIIFMVICFAIFLGCISYMLYDSYNKNKDKNSIAEIEKEYFEENKEKESKLELVQKVQELKKENDEVIGWIKIGDSKIDFPLLQNADNEYYLTHDYKKQNNRYGSIFLKSECDINDVNSNLLIYGHNMGDEERFNCLLNYKDKEYYKTHKTIKLATESEEREYEVISTFKSRIFYQDEKNVFRFYQSFKFANENEYNTYLDNAKKIQFYDTGVVANYGEQLLTLVTCEYSQENGRMVVIAKKNKVNYLDYPVEFQKTLEK